MKFFFDLKILKNHRNGSKRSCTYLKQQQQQIQLCSKCGKKFDKRSKLQTHEYLKHMPDVHDIRMLHSQSSKSFECLLCKEERFLCATHLRIHMKKKHPTKKTSKKHECPICHLLLGRLDTMKRHLLVHSNNRPFQCYCGKRFKTNLRLRVNIIAKL